jgi:hypothetical protein
MTLPCLNHRIASRGFRGDSLATSYRIEELRWALARALAVSFVGEPPRALLGDSDQNVAWHLPFTGQYTTVRVVLMDKDGSLDLNGAGRPFNYGFSW